MTLYTRPQLAVLLLIVLTAGLGLGIGHWRRAHPDLVDRLESFDRAPAAAVLAPETPTRARPESASRRAAPAKGTPPAQPVDINRASEEDLRALPGIGGVLAARIVEARERDGPFASLDDLGRVKGLGRAKREKIAATIAVSP
jgi:competence ComEA-like helix-hairpin-helix protein